MVETEALSESGSVLSKVEFRDIKLQAELSDDLFLLPNGLEIHKPKSIKDYLALVSLITMPNRPERTVSEPAGAARVLALGPASPPLGPVRVDPVTGDAIAPVPAEMSSEEFQRLTTPASRKLESLRSGRVNWVFVLSVQLVVFLVVFALYRWWKTSK